MFKFLKPRKKSEVEKWAEEEIRLACKKADDYGRACYKSAMRACKILLNDDHSGFSIHLTKNILNRLINVQPLTPIEDVPEVWNDISMWKSEEGIVEKYQCKRMSSLFKDIYDDGTVKLTDVDRVSCINIDNPISTWHCRLGDDIVDELFPIEMPYYPTNDPYKLYMEDFLLDPENGDYDTQGFFYLITPDGDRVEVNKFYKEQDGEWVEIGVEEYNDRKMKSELRRLNDVNF